MGCKCHSGTAGIADLQTMSLMPRYARAATAGLGDGESTGSLVAATVGWIAVGGVCGAALYVAVKEFLKS